MSTIFADLRRWMFEEALPFWSVEGIDRDFGGFVEHFTLTGEPYTDTKRVFVLCRQIYVFAHAAHLGWSDGGALCEQGWRFLQKARLADGGWARRVVRDGRPMDETPDLYVLSFVLFAAAWYYRLSGEKSALTTARETLAFINRRMGHAAGGFVHEVPALGPRQQNPHMHMVEGLLALAAASKDEIFLDAAGRIAELFTSRFFDTRTQTLPEFFAEDWSRLNAPQGRLTEPGHQFEWAWILADYQAQSGRDVRDVIFGLYTSAERHGVDPSTHVTYNSVRDDGMILSKASRIWPNTERIKAVVAMFELAGRPPQEDLEQSGRLLLDHYIAPALRGRWIDIRDEHGAPSGDKIPTSSLYHLFLAFAEALRIEPAVTAPNGPRPGHRLHVD